MKLKTRLAVTFFIITLAPVILICAAAYGLSNYQAQAFRKAYGLNEQIELLSANSMQIFNRLTQKYQAQIRQSLDEDSGRFENTEYLNQLNQQLLDHYAYLIVRKDSQLIYNGSMDAAADMELCSMLPEYSSLNDDLEGGIYLDGDSQHLLKQMDFRFPDDSEGTVFIVSRVDEFVPEVKSMIAEMLFMGLAILIGVGFLLTLWIYRSILRPLGRLQEATKQIRDGNLDFTLEVENEDEIDLKTPITAIKGYVEGIMDGVASSPEKLDKYIRTIYNKANDMDRLIDELTFYSKIDTNKIPYTFTKINVAQYFRDCVEEVGLDMEAKGIELGYFNYVDEDVVVIADAEQMKRVINNIIGNSVKYIDKKKGIINIRIKDVGDFIEVEIEDNGKGIAQKDLPNIFDRFYRADSSRNSSKGGSGIGLSIVRKIIEDHGGKIWATSKEGIGTEIHFVLRKYQEVIQE